MESTIPKLTLPMDFGLEKLYEENNNNMFFILQDGKKLGAAALMLSIHSPVLDKNYIKPGVQEVDVQEFPAETAVMFVEAMYNGKLGITTENFREIHKLCSVFDVNWMLAKCIQFFQGAVDKTDANLMLFLFGEAMWVCETRKSDVLFNIWREGLAAREDLGMNYCAYIKSYIEEHYEEVSEYTLQKLIAASDDHKVFVDLISSRFQAGDVKLDKTSRFLLQNIELSKCMDSYLDDVTEMFDVLLQDENSPDFTMINRLQRQTSKAYMKSLQSERATHTAVTPQESPTITVCNQPIPNMFHDIYEVARGDTVLITLDNVAAVSRNLYMILEYMDVYGDQITESVVEKLGELMRERGWDPVLPRFVDCLQYNLSEESKHMLGNSAVITSSTATVCVISEEVTTMWDFPTTSAVYKFKIPGQSASDNEQESGFLIEVTAGSPDSQQQFDIQLVVDRNRYPADIQYQAIAADKLHLVLECQVGNTWKNWCTSWCGRPEYRDDGSVWWGGTWSESDLHPARLVVYISAGGEHGAQ